MRDLCAALVACVLLLAAPPAGARPCRGKSKIARLLCKVESRSPRTRAKAVAALTKLGPRIAAELVETVRTRVEIGKLGTDEKVVAAISGLVVAAGPDAVKGILALMKRDDDDYTLQVEAVLSPQAAEIVGPLTATLSDPSPPVRRMAALLVGRAEARGKPAVPALVKALASDKDDRMRKEAAEALGRIGAVSPAVVPALVRALGDRKPEVVNVVVDALQRIGPAAEPAAGRLLKLVPRRGVQRARVSLALAAMGASVVPDLVEALRGGETEVHDAVIAALRRLGPRARAAVKPLTAHLRRTRKHGLAGLEALAAMGGPKAAGPAVPLVTPLLKDKAWVTRVMAAEALGKAGPAGAAAVPALRAALQDKAQPFAHRVRAAAAQALGKIGPSAGPAVPALRDAAGDASWQVREQAITALGRIGKPALAALPQLRTLCKDRAANIRRAASEAVKALEASR